MGTDIAAVVETVERRAWQDIYDAAPAEIRSELGLGTRRIGPALLLWASKVPDTQFNRAFCFGVDAPSPIADLEEAVAEMRRSAAAARWWLQPSPERPEILDWATGQGFRAAPRPWAKLVRRPGPIREVATTFRIEEIGADRGADFGDVVCAGFGAPAAIGRWLAALAGRENWRLYVGYDGDVPSAVGAGFRDGEVAWLGAGATAPKARNRGGQGAIMGRRIADAFANGCRLVVTETGEKQPGVPSPSFDNMMRHGFEVVHIRTNLIPPETGG